MKEISANEVHNLLESGKKLNIIDVREDEEVEQGIIPEAVHIPLGQVESRMNELDKSKEYIIVCRSGRRSANASEFLQIHGFETTNMTGGMLEWEGTVEK
ncbi:rhodanese-like domain-containing protein [Aquibacillus halophilus]|uniref:Rhodanese-like domain-containing protein n=1 Tax=Aquibacillus halophilus TaxID=930132 RepID=A0A6A8D9W6_9BACI|nr:rhodanese-like domain-containing protein [Aquibacillus halophilus]MRH42545.1 rhodanese-like domain-containing protein [Aquibacillus halophilus]